MSLMQNIEQVVGVQGTAWLRGSPKGSTATKARQRACGFRAFLDHGSGAPSIHGLGSTAHGRQYRQEKAGALEPRLTVWLDRRQGKARLWLGQDHSALAFSGDSLRPASRDVQPRAVPRQCAHAPTADGHSAKANKQARIRRQLWFWAASRLEEVRAGSGDRVCVRLHAEQAWVCAWRGRP
jgi:hypothetical protein